MFNYHHAKAAHLRLGERGEKIAQKVLNYFDLDILCVNYEGPRGEIDIIAMDGAVICFVEVKTRRPNKRARPAASVNFAKRKKIIKTAHHYLMHIGSPKLHIRFDIIEIIMQGRRLIEASYWPDEFTTNAMNPRTNRVSYN